MDIDPDIITWIWFGAGIALMVSEFFLPGMISVFLGLGAIVVAGGRWLGLIESFSLSFAVFLLSSTLFVVFLRRLAVRFFPAETSYKSEDDTINAVGKIVTVVTTVKENDKNGRIRYQGTTWPASSVCGTIEPGQKARLISKDNIGWIIEAFSEDEEDETNLNLD